MRCACASAPQAVVVGRRLGQSRWLPGAVCLRRVIRRHLDAATSVAWRRALLGIAIVALDRRHDCFGRPGARYTAIPLPTRLSHKRTRLYEPDNSTFR